MNFLFSVWGSVCYIDDIERAFRRAEELRSWINLLNRVCSAPKLYNPLPIIARALNSLGLRCYRCIFQPRWRAGRWKAKT